LSDDAPEASLETGTAEAAPQVPELQAPLLFLSVLLIASCGLIYELVAGTLASYLLGDSVLQFSTVIGVYLSAMGLGSWLSRYVQKGLAHRFVHIELAVAVLGGLSAPVLFLAFAKTHAFRPVLYTLVAGIGTLVGLEIPLLMRILRQQVAFKDLVAGVLTLDYIGALFASLLFPLFLMPKLGLVRTSLVFGLLNALVGLWSTKLLRPLLGGVFLLRVKCLLVIALLGAGVAGASRFTLLAEEEIFQDEIVYAKTSAYQRIVLTHGRGSFQLFLNGSLQFSSADEYRYHEALVHPAFAAFEAKGLKAKRVLVCGGGDGLAVREILKHPGVTEVVLVDLDPAMTEMAAKQPLLAELNRHALLDGRVKVLNMDAMVALGEMAPGLRFDLAIVDFPDPHTYSVGKLYTTRFYRLLKEHLNPEGVASVQSTSPLMARRSFWCIAATMEAAGFNVRPYHLSVPSFGVWGFSLASPASLALPARTLPDLRHLTDDTMQAMFAFPRDMDRLPSEVNRLDNQVLVHLYASEWKRWS
jgi:spermidine synthase